MKKIIFVFICLFVSGVFVGCNDDDDDNSGPLTNEEAAELVANSLAASTGGVAQQTSFLSNTKASIDTSAFLKNSTASEDIILDTTFTIKSDDNAALYYNYSLSYSCDQSIINFSPTSTIGVKILVDFFMIGEYQTSRMKSEDSVDASYSFIKSNISATKVAVTGSYTRTGDQVSSIGNKNSYTSIVKIIITEMTVDYGNSSLLSGLATFEIGGETTTGLSFNFTGSIKFNDDNTATIVVNGNSFIVNLATGDLS